MDVIQISCSEKLKIELFNKTGFDLNSVSVGEKLIGNIKKNTSVVISDLNELEMQDGLPFTLPIGAIGGKKRDTSIIGLCATGRRNMSTGHYKFDIKLKENENGFRLFWKIHK